MAQITNYSNDGGYATSQNSSYSSNSEIRTGQANSRYYEGVARFNVSLPNRAIIQSASFSICTYSTVYNSSSNIVVYLSNSGTCPYARSSLTTPSITDPGHLNKLTINPISSRTYYSTNFTDTGKTFMAANLSNLYVHICATETNGYVRFYSYSSTTYPPYMTITYTEGGVVHYYTTAATSVACTPYYWVNSQWVQVDPQYYDNGVWKQLQ